MPYPTAASMPEAVRKLPAHAGSLWRSAYNAAYDESEGDEGKAAATAWAAVKKAGYRKNEGTGKWERKRGR